MNSNKKADINEKENINQKENINPKANINQASINEKVNELKERLRLPLAMSSLCSISYWDEHVDGGSPAAASETRAAAAGLVQTEIFRLMTSPGILELIDTLAERPEALSPKEAAMVKELKRESDRLRKIPADEYEAYQVIVNEAETVWRQAKADSDFAKMAPYYEKIIAFKRKMADWYGYEKHPYDALLDLYEEGGSTQTYDRFFAALKEHIVPLLQKAAERTVRDDFLNLPCDAKKQAAFNRKLAQEIGFDLSRGLIGETEHPFCTTMFPDDVRITTHYYENMPFSALYSTLHEAGHAIYEQNIDRDLYAYMLFEGASCAIHESQSRFYENMIGRSIPYLKHIESGLKEMLPALEGITAEEICRAINQAKPSLIRIEADELTYCLHIMVRYELEKDLIAGHLAVADLPAAWNALYEKYLGLTPPSDALGVLQDVHWCGGEFGYFPSYAIGSAYAAQFLYAMNREMDVYALVEKGDFAPIREWLSDKIHKHGKSKSPEELIVSATGESFDPKYYIRYLREKFA